MVGNSKKILERKDVLSFQSLLAPKLLHSSANLLNNLDINSRENLKSLLKPFTPNTAAEAPKSSSESHSLIEKLSLYLKDDFLKNRHEILKLNRARKQQVELSLREILGSERPLSMEKILNATLGSAEHSALLHFSEQLVIFHLAQILLIKRWIDLKFLPSESLNAKSYNINWLVSTFIKKHSSYKLLLRHDWSFLKQNIFSWFSPQTATWEKIIATVNSHSLAKVPENYLLNNLFSAQSTESTFNFYWKTLFKQKKHDLRISTNANNDQILHGNHAALLSGLSHGQALQCLAQQTKTQDQIWAFSSSDFEQFLTEIQMLWFCEKNIPKMNIIPKSTFSHDEKSDHSFIQVQDEKVVPNASIALCSDIEDAPKLINLLNEHGLILIAGTTYWLNDISTPAQSLRESILKKTSIRWIVDLRQVVSENTISLPKSIVLLEKNTSKEVRDSSRPQILKIRGALSNEVQLEKLFDRLLELLNTETMPGEVASFQVDSSSLKIESMAAATNQQLLKSSPWHTLTETSFYESSSVLRRYPTKAFGSGNIIRIKNITDTQSLTGIQRAIFLNEEKGKSIEASLTPAIDGDNYLYVLDKSLLENPLFYTAMINSSSLQFWYRLEWEQDLHIKTAKTGKRQTEQMLKLMPVVRLFSDINLLPTPSIDFSKLTDINTYIEETFSGPLSLSQKANIHSLIISLEEKVNSGLKTIRDIAALIYPNMKFCRWNLAEQLPEISALQALSLLKHLDHAPLAHHPAFHAIPIIRASDFKISNIKLLPSTGPFSELYLYSGADAYMRIHGPTLYLKAAEEEIQKRLGRPWHEIKQKLQFPIDPNIVAMQISEISSTFTQEIKKTSLQVHLLDKIFGKLLGLSSENQNYIQTTNSNVHIEQQVTQINPLLKTATVASFELPKQVLQ